MRYYFLLQKFIVGMVLNVALQFAIGFPPPATLLIGASMYMALGVVIDCISSLMLDPIYKVSGLLNYDSYWKYVTKSKEDPTIQDLSAQRIFYRNLTTGFMIILLFTQGPEVRLALVTLILLSLLRMRKFHTYILERMDK